MQQFRVELLITVNTTETVSATEVGLYLKELLQEEYDAGTAEVQSCEEA